MRKRRVWVLGGLAFVFLLIMTALAFGSLLFTNRCPHWNSQSYLVEFQWNNRLEALKLHAVPANSETDPQLRQAAFVNARDFATKLVRQAQMTNAEGQFGLYLCGCGKPFLASFSDADIPQLDQLMNAAAEWDLPTVRQLLADGVSVNARWLESGSTGLIYAASDPRRTFSPARIARLNHPPDPATFNYLLSAGADPNVRGYLGVTALMSAGDALMTRALLARGAAVNVSDDRGWTAVMYAVSAGDFQKVESLIAAGAKIDSKDRDGWTPLMYATYAGAFHMVSILLKAGANANATNNKGETALDIAKKKRCLSSNDREIIELLIRK